MAENEPQDTAIVRAPGGGGYGVDALWNDDAHHAAVVALTGRREAYYRDYQGTAQELISCARFGYLYQGQWYAWQTQRRGTPALDLPPHAFVSLSRESRPGGEFARSAAACTRFRRPAPSAR